MQESDKDKIFDQQVRDLIEDMEEPVPPFVEERLFATLDSGRQRIVAPLLRILKWTAAATTAAAITLGVILWTDHPKYEEQRMAAMQETSETTPASENADGIVSIPANNGDIIAASNHNNSILAEDRNIGDSNRYTELVDATEQTYSNERTSDASDNEPSIKDGGTKSGEDKVSSGASSADRPDKESVTEDDDNILRDEFGQFPDDNDKGRESHVSIVIGGNVSSNGEASSLGSRTSYLSSGNLQDATILRQTGSESSYSIPVTFGVGTRIELGKRWGINTGLTYTMLQRSFAGVYTRYEDGKMVDSRSSEDIRHTIHYIGIPVNAYYDLLKGKRTRLYAYAGGSIERAVSNKFRINGSDKDIVHHEDVKGVQLSAGAGLGVEFNIVKDLGIYINPGFQYFFDCDQPVSIRTQQPFMMNFEIGLRIGI